MNDDKIFFVTVTGIICKEGKMLIAKRAAHEKVWPNRWTVPGGKMSRQDYECRQKDKGELWYGVVEDVMRREIREEVHLEVTNMRYVTSMAYVRPDGHHCVIISFACDYQQGEILLCPALTEYAWVTLEEAKKYDLIEGIWDELASVKL